MSWLLPLGRFLAVAGFLNLVGCQHLAATDQVRSQELPIDHLRPAFASWGLERLPLEDLSTEEVFVEEFRVRTYDDVQGAFTTIRGEVWLPRGVQRPPLVVISPILGGYYTGYAECRWFADAAVARGYGSFFLYQEEIILDPERDGTGLERTLRSLVRDEIKALDVILGNYAVDADRLASLGISLGGIRALLLAAAEPRIKAHVICLAGANLHEIVRDSREGLVRDYVEERCRRTGTDSVGLARELSAHFVSDPVNVARSVDPRSVLMFLARFDRHVPIANGWQLHDALGSPEVRITPLGHYTSILLIFWVARHTFDFFDRRLGYGDET